MADRWGREREQKENAKAAKAIRAKESARDERGCTGFAMQWRNVGRGWVNAAKHGTMVARAFVSGTYASSPLLGRRLSSDEYRGNRRAAKRKSIPVCSRGGRPPLTKNRRKIVFRFVDRDGWSTGGRKSQWLCQSRRFTVSKYSGRILWRSNSILNLVCCSVRLF
mgnify:CR=1 FL=1